jgi:surface protein
LTADPTGNCDCSAAGVDCGPAGNEPIGNWDVSAVTDFVYLFVDRDEFNADISAWNTASAVSMRNMFSEARAFNQPIGNWDVSQVSSMSYMFYNAKSFNQPLNDWDTSSNRNLYLTFGGAESFDQDLDNWVVDAVTDMDRLFTGATMFNGDITTWNPASTVYVSFMFAGCLYFDQDITHWRHKAMYEYVAEPGDLNRESRTVVFYEPYITAGTFYNATAWMAKFERIPGTERMYYGYNDELGELVPSSDYDYSSLLFDGDYMFASDWRFNGPSELWRLKAAEEHEHAEEPLLGTITYNGQEVPEWFLAFASFIFALFILVVVFAGVKSLFCSRPKVAQYAAAPPAQVVYRA